MNVGPMEAFFFEIASNLPCWRCSIEALVRASHKDTRYMPYIGNNEHTSALKLLIALNINILSLIIIFLVIKVSMFFIISVNAINSNSVNFFFCTFCRLLPDQR